MKFNKYSLFIILLTTCTCFGSFGGAFQVDRILAILFSPWLISCISKKGNSYARRAFVVLLLFYLYMAMSFILTPDKQEGMKQLVYYPIHFLLFIELIVFARFATDPLKCISSGWMIAVLLCSIVAYWELTTGQHLYLAKEQGGAMNTGTEILQHMTASVTFNNYNGYVTFLCFSFPWVFYILLDKKRRPFEILLAVAALIASTLVIIINASRGGVLAVVIMLAIYYIYSKKTNIKNVILGLLIIVFLFLLIRYGEEITAVFFARTAEGRMFEDMARYTIWKNALRVFWESLGMGVGIGGIHVAMDKYAHGGVLSVHNMFLEILVQYGVIIFIAFISIIWKLLKKAFLIERNRKIVSLMAIIAMPVYTIIDSGYLLNTHLYVLIASIYIFVNLDLIQYRFDSHNTYKQQGYHI